MTAAWTPGSTDPKAAYAEFRLHLKEITPRLFVIPTVIALNLLVFGAMSATGVSPLNPTPDAAIRWGANFGPLTLAAQPWRLLTNMFVHFGVVHLLANMLVLGTSGEIERLFGPVHFAAIYLAAGLAGSLASVAVHPAIVSAGASGAVFGIYGALGALVLLRRDAIPPLVLGRLGKIAGTFVAYNIMFGLANKGIDNAAHVGGLVGGAIAGALLLRPLVPGRASHSRRPALVALAVCALTVGAARALPAPLTVQSVAHAVGAEEERALPAYNQLVQDLNAGRIDPFEAARRLKSTILPQWRSMRASLESDTKRFAAQRGTSAREKLVLDLLSQSVVARDDGWTAMVAPLQANDHEAFVQASRDMEATVQRLLDEIQALKAP